MTDFHSHILPGIDDGSKSAEMSLGMLSMYPDCVTDIFLTPHFYPDMTTPEHFLEKRQAALERLQEATRDLPHPRFHAGAEVAYYEGIHRNAFLDRLKIAGTDFLLVEMPQEPWSRRMIDSLLEIRREQGIIPVLAHIDRYKFGRGEFRQGFDYYVENGGLVQVNCDAFLSFFSRRNAVKMIREGSIQFIGTDAHNTGSRKPNLREALETLERGKMGDVVERIEENCKDI